MLFRGALPPRYVSSFRGAFHVFLCTQTAVPDRGISANELATLGIIGDFG